MLPDETRRFLELVRDAGTELAELLDDVVDVARVTRAPLDVRELDVGTLARELIAAVLGPSVPVGRARRRGSSPTGCRARPATRCWSGGCCWSCSTTR